jgi:hypothetical protein
MSNGLCGKCFKRASREITSAQEKQAQAYWISVAKIRQQKQVCAKCGREDIRANMNSGYCRYCFEEAAVLNRKLVPTKELVDTVDGRRCDVCLARKDYEDFPLTRGLPKGRGFTCTACIDARVVDEENALGLSEPLLDLWPFDVASRIKANVRNRLAVCPVCGTPTPGSFLPCAQCIKAAGRPFRVNKRLCAVCHELKHNAAFKGEICNDCIPLGFKPHPAPLADRIIGLWRDGSWTAEFDGVEWLRDGADKTMDMPLAWAPVPKGSKVEGPKGEATNGEATNGEAPKGPSQPGPK